MSNELKITAKADRKKLPVKKLTEKFIEESYLSKEKEVKKLEAKFFYSSSISTKNKEVSYTPMIAWDKYDVDIIVQNLVLFSEALSGVKLYPYQKEFQKRVFHSMLVNDGEEITALFSRQSGKTECIACTLNTLMLCLPVLADIFPKELSMYSKGLSVGLFAPTGEQAYTTHSRMDARLSSSESLELLSDPAINADKKYSSGILTINGPKIKEIAGKDIFKYSSFCKLQTAAKQAKIESKTYHLVVIEEAQEVDTMKVQKSIRPMVSSVNGTIIQIGTAMPVVSDFYNAINRNRRTQHHKKVSNHFEFNYKITQKYNPKYKAFIQKEKERIGEDSDSFRMAYNLEWLLEKGMALTPQMFDEYLKKSSLMFEYGSDNKSVYVAGIDLAKSMDSTVITIAKLENLGNDISGNPIYLKKVVNWVEMSGDNWEIQFKNIIDIIEIYNISLLSIDATGPGDPIVDRLEALLSDTDCKIFPVVFNQKNKHAMAVLFYEELKKFYIQIPCHQTVKRTRRYKNFLDQFLSCEKNYKGNFMQLEHQDIKGAKDDYVDSLLLLLYGVKESMLGEVIVSNNVFFENYSPRSERFNKALKQIKKRGAKIKYKSSLTF